MSRKNKYVYHITTDKALPSILKYGLEPRIGANAKLVEEDEPYVYLCHHASIPFWKIMLNSSVVLQIANFDESKYPTWNYSCYDEIQCDHTIPPSDIKQIYTPRPTVEQMQKLCYIHIDGLNKIVVDMARYDMYKDRTTITTELLNQELNSLLAIGPRLDFSVLSKKEIRKYLKNEGENGEYTILDTYINTEIRLFEQLLYYPNDILTPKRKQLYQQITTSLKGCLNGTTGGWTG